MAEARQYPNSAMPNAWAQECPAVWGEFPNLGVSESYFYDIEYDQPDERRCGVRWFMGHAVCILWPHHDGPHIPGSLELIERQGVAITGMQRRSSPSPSSDAEETD